MSRFQGRRVILLTGASTGLGLAISQALLRGFDRGVDQHLILTARAGSLSRFADAAIVNSERVWLRALDVTSALERESVVAEAYDKLGGVDVLINNAGVAYRAVVEHVTDEERIAQMDINFRSPMELSRLVLPSMRQKRAGRIISISSVGGMMAMPTMAVYSASKFALEGATEALYYETRPFGIRVSLIQPGFIRSSSFQRVHYTPLSERSESELTDPYHAHYENMGPFIEKVMGWAPGTPEGIARVVLKAMNARYPKLRISATLDAQLFFWIRRLLPRRIYHTLLYYSLPHIRRWGRPILPPSQGEDTGNDDC